MGLLFGRAGRVLLRRAEIPEQQCRLYGTECLKTAIARGLCCLTRWEARGHDAREADQDGCEGREPLRHVAFHMAEVAVPRDLFAAFLERIQQFGVLPPFLQRG